ncbi:hypothetical protein ACS0TY_014126 [Phlomoides rotata]
MRQIARKKCEIELIVKKIVNQTIVVLCIGILCISLGKLRARRKNRNSYSLLDKIPDQIKKMQDLIEVSYEDCRNKLRMDQVAFTRLCHLLKRVGGLKSSRNISIAEKVAMFLSILAHHTKNRCVKLQFKRSGQTVSKHFHVSSSVY